MDAKNSTPSVAIFMRSVDTGQWSIERVFDDVVSGYDNPDDIEILNAPYRSIGLRNRLRIMFWAYRNRRPVNHIAGDIHFATFLLPRNRTILTVHDCERLSHFSGIKRWLLKTIWFSLPARMARVVTVISQQTRDDLLREVNIDASAIRVIPNPVSPAFVPSQRSFDLDNPRILQVGTRQNKNLERVIEALDGIKATLVILGELSDSQRAHIAELNIAHEVHTALSHEGVVELYAGSDFVVFASLFEGFGLPAIEAQASAKPLVTSIGQPFDEVVGTSAIRVNPHDVADIRRGILEIINNPARRETLVSDGLRNAGRFSAQTIAAHYQEVYREIYPGLE